MPLPDRSSTTAREPDAAPPRPAAGRRRWAALNLALLGAVLLLALTPISPDAAVHAATSSQPVQRLIVRYRDAALPSVRSTTAQRLEASGRAASAAHVEPSEPADEDDGALRRAGSLSQRHGLSLRDGTPVGRAGQVVLVDAGQDRTEVMRRLAADPDVAYVEEDRRAWRHAAPNDPLYAVSSANDPAAGQWYLRTPDATLRAAINAENAWSISNGSADVVVAVLDTGVRPDHPDLAGKLLPGYDFVSDAYVGNDGDGRDGDPTDPGDWVTANDRTTSPNGVCADALIDPSSSWHGTQMAGLIGAMTQNGVGMAGTGRHVRIVPIRVLGKCGGYTSDIADAIRWAAGLPVSGVRPNPNPARIISLSLGGTATTCSQTYQDAITAVRNRGAIVVSSAGNDGKFVGDPANCDGVIAVSGVDHDGYKAYFSNLGRQVTVSAPSGNGACVSLSCLYPILSTINKGPKGPAANDYTNGTTDRAAGTSYSTPLVSGVAALLLSVKPDASVSELTGYITRSARAFPAGAESACVAPSATAQGRCACTTATCGAGLLDAAAALNLAIAGGEPVSTIEPSTTQIVPGSTVVLDGGRSRPFGAIGYRWEIAEGSGIASFGSNATDTSLTTLTVHAAGIVKVRLTVSTAASPTAAARSASSTVVLRAGDAAVSVVTPPVAPSSGGGAMQPGWLLGLAAAVVLLGWLRRAALDQAAADA
ncbi:S8 family peptidase [Leptothrix discophora]|uniref:S8 family peptidase n=1 Tax=Leptothrix discophora TaxID=89 RepID=A0ABT9FZL4_LEPDI|nr:S8 family peptidase [Leptothrix discophora]MDP4299661.1 S8 family peptidase [Leptothrix discophora]